MTPYVLLKGSVFDVIGVDGSTPGEWAQGITAWLDYDVPPARDGLPGGYVIGSDGEVHPLRRVLLTVDPETGKLTGGGSMDGIWVIGPGSVPSGFTVTITVTVPGNLPSRVTCEIKVKESDGSYLIGKNAAIPSGGSVVVSQTGPAGLSIVPDPTMDGFYIMLGTPLIPDADGLYPLGV